MEKRSGHAVCAQPARLQRKDRQSLLHRLQQHVSRLLNATEGDSNTCFAVFFLYRYSDLVPNTHSGNTHGLNLLYL